MQPHTSSPLRKSLPRSSVPSRDQTARIATGPRRTESATTVWLRRRRNETNPKAPWAISVVDASGHCTVERFPRTSCYVDWMVTRTDENEPSGDWGGGAFRRPGTQGVRTGASEALRPSHPLAYSGDHFERKPGGANAKAARRAEERSLAPHERLISKRAPRPAVIRGPGKSDNGEWSGGRSRPTELATQKVSPPAECTNDTRQEQRRRLGNDCS